MPKTKEMSPWEQNTMKKRKSNNRSFGKACMESFEPRLMLSHHRTLPFGPAVSINVGHSVTTTAEGDFNRDGHQDIIAAGDGLYIVLGAGKGRFYAARQIVSGAVSNPVVADFNNDGKLDIAFNSASGVSVVFGTGRGTFYSPVTAVAGQAGIEGVADFNRDGKADLITNGPNVVKVYLSNGNGTFSSTASFSFGGPNNTGIVADLNGDGNPDLINDDEINNQVDIELGHGNGTFSADGTISTPASTAAQILVGDFNRDRKIDLLDLNGLNNYVDLGTGAATFQPGILFHLINDLYEPALGYLNAGRTLDLALLSTFTGNITVLSGDGTGKLVPYTSIAAGSGHNTTANDDIDGLSVADLNSDGISDLICTRPDLDTINVYFAA